jgi:POT family proton-dependent oligopeptide transporter
MAPAETHPKGLYALFATEMWERFGFYTMIAMLTLYMRDAGEGFGFSTARATGVYSWYQACVYASPLIGGLLADRLLGYRNSITIGGLFFMAGYFMLAVPKQLPIFYLSLVLLVIGNGFFKPNVSSMVGNLYPEGSHLKDRAYLIFYMGINIGAFLAPICAEFVRARFGFNRAFAVAGLGMIVCLAIFWGFRRMTARADRPVAHGESDDAGATAGAKELPSNAAHDAMSAVPEWKRIFALIVIFLIVIVFWMIFHQNGSTLTFWANDNTAWKVTGIISNAINPFWIITLSLPLAAFWGFLDRHGLEPSTPTKIACGMLLTGVSFLILYFAALNGGYTKPSTKIVKAGSAASQYYVSIPDALRSSLGITAAATQVEVPVKGGDGGTRQVETWPAVNTSSAPMKEGDLVGVSSAGGRLEIEPLRKVSPLWLIVAYLVISLGELMLSPMGLSLVSKVAPPRMRGLMMGGWFLATAIGNKLTAIGAFWDIWSHARFFLTLSMMALAMAVILTVLLRPLKKAMPGV